MLAFISLFFPGAASVFIFEAGAGKEFSAKQSLLRYGANTLIINLLCLLVKKFVFNTAANPLFEGSDMVPNVAVVYMALALAFGIIIAIIEILFSKKVNITVEESPDEKQEKKD